MHYCTTGSDSFLLPILTTRSFHVSASAARLRIFNNSIFVSTYIIIFTPATMAVHKTLPFYPEYLLRYIDVLPDAANNDYLLVRKLEAERAPKVPVLTMRATAALPIP